MPNDLWWVCAVATWIWPLILRGQVKDFLSKISFDLQDTQTASGEVYCCSKRVGIPWIFWHPRILGNWMQLQPNLILRSPTPTRTMAHLRRTQLLLGYNWWICQLRGFPVWITVPTKWFLSMASALKICFVGEPSPWSGWVFFTQVDLSSVLGVGNGSALVRFQWMFVKRIPNDQQISASLLSNRFSTQTWVVPPIRWLGTLYIIIARRKRCSRKHIIDPVKIVVSINVNWSVSIFLGSLKISIDYRTQSFDDLKLL
jgi:hypothetical protein